LRVELDPNASKDIASTEEEYLELERLRKAAKSKEPSRDN